MLGHFLNLVAQAFLCMPERVGSNWGGVVFSLVLFVLGESVAVTLGSGWAQWKKHWGQNVLVGFGVVVVGWLGLFFISVVATVYDDHQNLVGATVRIKYELARQREEAKRQLEQDHLKLSAQINSLTTSCAVKEAIKDTLEKQNRDEQVLIAGCQSQAIKLLAPEPPRISLVPALKDVAKKRAQWVALTNKKSDAATVLLNCDGPFDLVSGAVVGVNGNAYPPVKINNYNWQITLGSLWTPTTPLFLVMNYHGNDNLTCDVLPK